MRYYWLAFIWGICVLASFVGWGALVGAALFPKNRFDWGMKAGWGISLAVVIGGVLNLFGWISRPMIFALVGLGLALFVGDVVARRKDVVASISDGLKRYRANRFAALGLLVLSAVLVLRYAGGICEIRHGCDNLPAYLVLPVRMLQEGAIGVDPFCARRIMSALGGHSFLLTYALCTSRETGVFLIEPLMGTLVGLGLLLGYARRVGVPRAAAVWIALLFLVIEPRHWNVSSSMMGLALFLCLVRTLDGLARQPERTISGAAIVALVAAAICALKGTHVPACIAFVALSYVILLFRSRMDRKACLEALLAGSLGAALLLPWMLDMYRTAGTLFFPLLGRGCHASAMGLLTPTWRVVGAGDVARNIIFGVLLRGDVALLVLMAGILLVSRPSALRRGEAALACTAAAVFGLAATTFGIGSARLKDGFACVYAALFILMMSLVARGSMGSARRRSLLASRTVLLAFGVLLGMYWKSAVADARFIRGQIRQAVSFAHKDLFEKQRRRRRRAQDVIPEGAGVLVVIERPFLLDFRRHRVYVGDCLGLTSPPPGMPVEEGGQALADYLLANGIGYVMFAYADSAGYDHIRKIDPKLLRPWLRNAIPRMLAGMDTLQELRRTKRRLFDDGRVAVFDISEPTKMNRSEAPDTGDQDPRAGAGGGHSRQASTVR